MYAVVKTGGKQYRVSKDDKLIIDRVSGEAGDKITLDEVLLLGDGDKVEFGKPTVKGASVGATLLKQTRGEKIVVFKHKRRKNYRRKQGHRQDLSLIQISEISSAGKAKAKAEAKPETKKKSVSSEAKPAAKKAEAKAKPKTEKKAVSAKAKTKPKPKTKTKSVKAKKKE